MKLKTVEITVKVNVVIVDNATPEQTVAANIQNNVQKAVETYVSQWPNLAMDSTTVQWQFISEIET
jgi:hypothetical protein